MTHTSEEIAEFAKDVLDFLRAKELKGYEPLMVLQMATSLAMIWHASEFVKKADIN